MKRCKLCRLDIPGRFRFIFHLVNPEHVENMKSFRNKPKKRQIEKPTFGEDSLAIGKEEKNNNSAAKTNCPFDDASSKKKRSYILFLILSFHYNRIKYIYDNIFKLKPITIVVLNRNSYNINSNLLYVSEVCSYRREEFKSPNQVNNNSLIIECSLCQVIHQLSIAP